MFDEQIHTPIVKISDRRLTKAGIELYMKREDLTHPYISGNKFRKLKYNLLEAKNQGQETLLTFGGAYSNHIHALAYAGKKYHFNTIGVIRGDMVLPLNPTLRDASDFGMKLHFISRSEYRCKTEPDFLEGLRKQYGDFYLVPEGGTNAHAVKGCAELVDDCVKTFDMICCAAGTGGTTAGIIAGLNGKQNVIGFPVLKPGEFLEAEIVKLLETCAEETYQNWCLMCKYHFGGYAKFDSKLIEFINRFNRKHHIPLDPVYTGKMVYGIYDLVSAGFFKRGQQILAIHTGGLQGIAGFNHRFGNLIDD